METSESTQPNTQEHEWLPRFLGFSSSIFRQIRQALPILLTIACSSCAKDTDRDGLSDAEEMAISTDINSPDSDGDFLSDYQEVYCGLNPNNSDIDGDGLLDGCEVDLGSMMGGYVHDIIRFRKRDRIAWKILVNGTQQRNLVQTLCVMSNDLDRPYKTRLHECPWLSSSQYRIYITHTDINDPDTDGDGTNDFAGGQIVVPDYITLKNLQDWHTSVLSDQAQNPCNFRFRRLSAATQAKKVD